MKLTTSIFALLIALNRINGEMMATMDMFYNMSTTDMDMDPTADDMGTTDDSPDASTSTTMYTTDIVVSQPDLTLDDDPLDVECLFGFTSAISLLDGEDSYLDLCAISMEDRIAINIEVTIPADQWAVVGFKDPEDEDESSMTGYYAVVIPKYERDLMEVWIDGTVDNKPCGEVLESTITVISDVIEDKSRTMVFQRYATIELEDIGQSADNLLAVNNYYYNLDNLAECDAEVTLIYAVSECPSDDSESVTVSIDEVDGEECEINFDSANQYTIMVTFIISSIIAILV